MPDTVRNKQNTIKDNKNKKNREGINKTWGEQKKPTNQAQDHTVLYNVNL